VARDIHQHYWVIAGVDREARVRLAPVRGEHADLEGWWKKNLRATDHVALLSTSNAWHVDDLLSPLAERVGVANPIQGKQLASARVKPDMRDTLILARLLAANLVPEVGVPPTHVRQLRQLLAPRRQLVEPHTQIVNRRHRVAHRRQPYRHFSHERIAYTYLTWAWQLDDEARQGLTRQQFTRDDLMRVGIGHDLTRMALDPQHPHKIASEAELLALRPEWNHIE
jgi:transposase